jgi:AAA domain
MTSDDGEMPPRSPDETSNGGERMSSNDFWRLVDEQNGTPTPPESTGAELIVEQPIGSALSLEERLSIAQSQGLGPNLRRQLAFVGAGESVFEFQVLGVRRYPQDSFDKSKAAHARGPEEAVALCTEADAMLAHGVYLMPARLRPGVESRHAAPGRWFDIPKGGGTTDSDIEARLVLAVDFDVKRPSAISATEEEMQRSVRVAQNAWSYLAHHLGESSLAYLHSGNGRQIHIALDAIPVNDDSKIATSGLLVALAHLFNTPDVVVDEKLYDAKRILPACGTTKKKGAHGVEERPHRRTAIVTPEAPTRVPLVKLVELARHIWEGLDPEGRAAVERSFGVKPQQQSGVVAAPRNPGSPYDLANSVDPQSVAEWLGLYNPRGEVVCPGCGETSGVAVLNHGLKCHHNRCKDRGRSGFRTNIDLVAEVRHIAVKEAVVEISERFGLNAYVRPDAPQQAAAEPPPNPQSRAGQSPSPVAPVPGATTGTFAYTQPRITKISTTEIFMKLPDINWLVKELHIVAGRPTLVAGYGFSGKTLIAQSAMLGMASGFPVWGKFTPTRPIAVWHLDYEQGSYATKRRYQRLAVGHGIPRDALEERLQVSIFPDVYLDSPDAVDVYAKATEGVSVCALDALRGATPTMDENDSTIRRCLDNLSRISEKNGTAFMVLHHAGKTRDGENSDPRKIPRGSSAIFDACGCVFAVEGEKNEPKLVAQTKAPAEAEGAALADFYVSIDDVQGEVDGRLIPTAGLKVMFQEGEAAVTEAKVAVGRMNARKQKLLAVVASMPGQLTSASAIHRVAKGKREDNLEAVREMLEAGILSQPGGGNTPIFVSVQGLQSPSREPVPTGSHVEREPVPGSPPLKGGTGAGGGGAVPSGWSRSADQAAKDRERAATSEADAAELFEVDERRWRAIAVERGWGKSRYESARALAKDRQQRARADGTSLDAVQLRGEDPRAWATERGWDDARIRTAMRFVPPRAAPPEPVPPPATEEPPAVAGSHPPAEESPPPARTTRERAIARLMPPPRKMRSTQVESDADLLSTMSRTEREAHVRDWAEERLAPVLEVLKEREPEIVKDAERLHRESLRGKDPEAWAREQRWSEVRILAAKLKLKMEW